MQKTLMAALAFVFAGSLTAAEPGAIKLPPPKTDGGMPLMQALKARRTAREFAPTPLPEQVLSNLFWAACGVNREDGRRTAPSALNSQEMDVYAVLPQGAYRYDPKAHALVPVAAGDLRPLTGTQPFVKDAPLNLVYVADYSRMTSPRLSITDEQRAAWSSAGAGFISQNVYLFCASEGLNTVVRGLVDRAAFAPAAGLRPEQRIVLAQTVGYPK